MEDNHHHKNDNENVVDSSNSSNNRNKNCGEARITRPTFLVDKDKCLSNLQNMKSKVDRANSISNKNKDDGNGDAQSTSRSNKTPHTIRFRPHCKTHASLEVGKWMKDYVGVQCITVSSLTMAKYFSTIFRDITVAFTVNILEIDTINDLLLMNDDSGSDSGSPFCLNLLVENVESVQFLQQHLKRPVGIYVKIDCGYGRTGVRAENVEQVANVVREMIEDDSLKDSSRGDGKKLVWKGLLTHAGQSYDCQTNDEILAVHRSVKAKMLSLRFQLQDMFPKHTNHIEVSIGDTPTCSVVEDVKVDWSGIDEIRPGNFVFYDVEQAQKIGCCSFDNIAVAVACPIVAKHPDRRELILYGGGVHLSKDRCTVRMSPVSNDDNSAEGTTKTIYGRVARSIPSSGLKWGKVIDGMYIRSTSQEHGIVVVPPQEDFNSYKIGDIVKVLPVHSCMTADCMCERGYLTTDGQWINRMKD